MENDNNQTQENRAFKKEDAYETLGIINTWIGNMDTKVSFALALAGVLIGVIFEKGMPSAFERITEVSKLAELSGGEIIAAILVALLYLSSFISILCFMLSIIARVKNLNNASSIFFFGSIGNMTLENYKSAVKDMDEKEMIGRFPVPLIDWSVFSIGGDVLYQQTDLAYPLFLCLNRGQEPVLLSHHFINLSL